MKNALEEEGWRGFLELCSKAKSSKDLDSLLCLFLTSEERVDLAARFLIVAELIKGKQTQREIAKTRKTSIGQITRGSNALKIIEDGLRKFLEKELKNRSQHKRLND
jgi:TrpR family trp operon transcriptional repressor